MRVLTVCTGNICRSPLAEQLLGYALKDFGVQTDSAGVRAMVGHGMPRENIAIAKNLGIAAPEAHKAKQLTEQHLADADLVLALAREHRRQIVEMLPRANKYTFTLREFARLIEGLAPEDFADLKNPDPHARMLEAVELVAQMRGALPPVVPEDDDVVDPYKRPFDVYARQAEELVPATGTIVKLFRKIATGAV